MRVSDRQFTNASSFMVCKPEPSFTSSSFVHFKNAWSSITLTLSGRMIFLSDSHIPNAIEPIVSTPDGISTLSSEEQP